MGRWRWLEENPGSSLRTAELRWPAGTPSAGRPPTHVIPQSADTRQKYRVTSPGTPLTAATRREIHVAPLGTRRAAGGRPGSPPPAAYSEPSYRRWSVSSLLTHAHYRSLEDHRPADRDCTSTDRAPATAADRASRLL